METSVNNPKIKTIGVPYLSLIYTLTLHSLSLKFSEDNHGLHTVKFNYISLLLHRNEVKGLGTYNQSCRSTISTPCPQME